MHMLYLSLLCLASVTTNTFVKQPDTIQKADFDIPHLDIIDDLSYDFEYDDDPFENSKDSQSQVVIIPCSLIPQSIKNRLSCIALDILLKGIILKEYIAKKSSNIYNNICITAWQFYETFI